VSTQISPILTRQTVSTPPKTIPATAAGKTFVLLLDMSDVTAADTNKSVSLQLYKLVNAVEVPVAGCTWIGGPHNFVNKDGTTSPTHLLTGFQILGDEVAGSDIVLKLTVPDPDRVNQAIGSDQSIPVGLSYDVVDRLASKVR
jgi:hypothetical protein